jgi:hypothetical protein
MVQVNEQGRLRKGQRSAPSLRISPVQGRTVPPWRHDEHTLRCHLWMDNHQALRYPYRF